MNELREAIAELEAEDDDLIDERELASLVDRLQAKLCRVVAAVKRRGDYQLEGYSAVTWVAKQCQMSRSAAADRLCVGAQLEKMPRIAQALKAGEIGFQAASVICHLQERVEQAGSSIDQEAWAENGRCFSIKDLSSLAASTWHAVDPAGFNLKVEEAHERRQLGRRLTICRVLGARRPDRPRQDAAALLLPPPIGARRGLAGGDGGRACRVHPARPARDDQAKMG